MMKKVLFIFVLAISLVVLAGCKAKDKEFTGSGITITLNDTFMVREIVQVPLYLESLNHIFMGLRESKSTLPYSIDTLSEYINAVLSNAGKSATVETYDQDGITFMYAYYESTVEDQEFGYMLICMEGTSYFYTMNFGCLADKLDGNKEQYLDWAKTIIVE